MEIENFGQYVQCTMHELKYHDQIPANTYQSSGPMVLARIWELPSLCNEYLTLLNDLEFPLLLLVSDWPRRHLLERTSE